MAREVENVQRDQELNRAKQEVGLVGHDGRGWIRLTQGRINALGGGEITTIGMDEEKKAE